MDDSYLKEELERQNQFQEGVDNKLKSAEWIVKCGRDLVDKYMKCKTIRGRKKIMSEFDYIKKRLAFEKRELIKLIEA